jgi:hypothetical protein
MSIFLVILFFIKFAAAQNSPQPNDFAFGIPLELEAGGSIYEIQLPRDVYEGVTRADLSDLRVFNGAGEVVPHLVRSLPAKTDSSKRRVPIPLFPLYDDGGESLEGLSLKVRRDAAGTIVDVQASDAQSENRRLISYLLDASHFEKPIDALIVSFNSKPQNQIWKIAVGSSDDLVNWRPLVISAPIVDLIYGGFTLRQDRISIPQTNAKYFRILWTRSEDAPVFEAVAAELATETLLSPREWLALSVSDKKSESAEYFFTSPGYMPVDRLRVVPPLNTIARATFWSRNENDEEWRHRGSALIYHLLNNGNEIVSPAVAVYSAVDLQWRMQAEGLGQELPQIEIGWVPQQLLFTAVGEKPFTLAYGNAGVTSRLATRLQLSDDFKPEVTSAIKSAKPGAAIPLGGESRLRPPALGSNPKNLILWGVLILGVLMLGWMAARLFRQMNSEA